MIVFIIIMPEFSSVLKRYTLIKITFNFENEKLFLCHSHLYYNDNQRKAISKWNSNEVIL